MPRPLDERAHPMGKSSQYFNLSQAATELDISCSTLRRRMERAGIQAKTNDLDKRQGLLTRRQVEELRTSQTPQREDQPSEPFEAGTGGPTQEVVKLAQYQRALTIKLRELQGQAERQGEEISNVIEDIGSLKAKPAFLEMYIQDLTSRMAKIDVLVAKIVDTLAKKNLADNEMMRLCSEMIRFRGGSQPRSKSSQAPHNLVSTSMEHRGNRATTSLPSLPPSVTMASRRDALPAGIILWRDFAKQHGIPPNTVYYAVEKTHELKVVVVRIGSATGHGSQLKGLDFRGQADFYQRYFCSPHFTPCPQCPHSALGNTAGTS